MVLAGHYKSSKAATPARCRQPFRHTLTMQVFKTDKRFFWTNELISWVWTFAFAALLYFGIKLFSSLTNENILVGVFVILLLKLGDSLTQYHVIEIQIDEQNKQMTLILNSIMSGEKIKKYELRQASSELINNSGLTRYLSSPFTLKIFLNPKDTLVIGNRYGFKLDTLTSVDKVLKSITNQA